ncbi:MAG: YesL family protein [Halanaerobiales bacterium]
MDNLFSIDGPLYKICTVIYQLLVLNFLWLIFSIPLVTIGASTTALFYVTGKIISDEYKNSLVKPFWHSFKNNFKQASIIWLTLVIGFIVIFINIRNIHLLGELGKYLAPVQFVILVELVIVAIYIFPLLARHHITVIGGFKAAFFIANRHIITTILCLAVFPGLYYLLMWKGYFILFIMSIYSFWIMYLVRDKFSRYAGSGEKSDYEENKID